MTQERYFDQIVVCRYDPAWVTMFELERTAVQAALGSLALTIEHVGSTAVPGLAAKPIIDLLVAVHDLGAARTRCVEPLQRLGYTPITQYESWLAGEMLF